MANIVELVKEKLALNESDKNRYEAFIDDEKGEYVADEDEEEKRERIGKFLDAEDGISMPLKL